MNKLSTEKRAQIVAALVEGMSIRATCRMTGAAKGTVLKLLADLGGACDRYLDKAMRGLNSKRIQCDEIWAFCYAKEKNLPDERRGLLGFGDVYTWTAVDADSKLVLSYLVGKRDAHHAYTFIHDVAFRLAGRAQITTDGLNHYIGAIGDTFGVEVDYAQLVKLYGTEYEGSVGRYSPPVCIGTRMRRVIGHPHPDHVSTSYVERQNLTMRMGMRRFTRLTNAFSKKLDNLQHAVALHFMHYNFARIHQTLRVTPAMEAGLSSHVWELEEIIGLLEAEEAQAQSA